MRQIDLRRPVECRRFRRVIFGIRVVGTIEDLPEAVRTLQVQRVVVTAVVSPEKRAQAADLARQAGVPLFEWRLEEAPLT